MGRIFYFYLFCCAPISNTYNLFLPFPIFFIFPSSTNRAAMR